MLARPLFLAEVTVYDPGLPGTRVLRYSSGAGHVTLPGDSPANTHYAPRIKAPAVVRRDAFAWATTKGATQIGYGDLTLMNGDGALDGLKAYAFDGRAIRILQGVPGAAYASFTPILVGTMEGCQLGTDLITIKVRDRQLEMLTPVQPTKYAGTNVLPDGLEGTELTLKGKPKPLSLGVVKNVPAICVNSDKLIYQVHDGAIASLDAVYDRGIPLGWPTKFSNVFGPGTPTGQIMAVSSNGSGTYVAVDTGNCLWYSTDGPATWTQVALTGEWEDVYWGDGKFIAVGRSGKIATSTNGSSWNVETSGTIEHLYAVVWAPGASLWVVGGSSGYLATSPTGTTWTPRTSQFGSSQIEGLAVGDGTIVAVGQAGKISTSTNATAWTARYSSNGAAFTTSWFHGVAYGAPLSGEFRAVSDIGVIIGSVDFGITWARQQCTFDGLAGGTAGSLWGIAYGSGLWVCGGSVADIGLSLTGSETWARFTVGFAALGVFFDGARWFLAAGGTGVAMSSPVPETYASLAELQNDTLAPKPGRVKVYLAGGYFRLGWAPMGLVTADVTEGATAADRSAGQVWKRMLVRKGLGSGDYSNADVTALDTATSGAVVGCWIESEMTYAALFDLVAGSVGAWWGPDQLGVFRIKQFVAPSGTPDLYVTDRDLLQPLASVSLNDNSRIPFYQTILRYGKVWAVQSDLAGAVSAARRDFVQKEWREVSQLDSSVLTTHLLATQSVEESLLAFVGDAQTEVTRRQTLRGVAREAYELVLELQAVALGAVLRLTHPRYGLSAGGGKDFVVLSVAPDADRKRISLLVWG